MKIVINDCFGGFGLSAKAVKRLAELEGKECYFFKIDYSKDSEKFIPISLEEAGKCICFFAFSVSNPNEILGESKRDNDGTFKTYNERYNQIAIEGTRDIDRTSPLLIQIVQELGKEANGSCAELKIIEIPDGIDYHIDEYDGLETVHENHKSWS